MELFPYLGKTDLLTYVHVQLPFRIFILLWSVRFFWSYSLVRNVKGPLSSQEDGEEEEEEEVEADKPNDSKIIF